MIITKTLKGNEKLTPEQIEELKFAEKNFRGTGPDTGMKNPKRLEDIKREGRGRKTIPAIVAGNDSGSNN